MMGRRMSSSEHGNRRRRIRVWAVLATVTTLGFFLLSTTPWSIPRRRVIYSMETPLGMLLKQENFYERVMAATDALPAIQIAAGGGDSVRRLEIEASIKKTWAGYVERAWGWDEVMPVSGQPVTTRNGWGVSCIEGLDTLLLVYWNALREEANSDWVVGEIKRSLAFVEHDMNFDVIIGGKDVEVDPFETIIRYLGGLVAVVDLLQMEIAGRTLAAHLDVDVSNVQARAVQLARKLGPGFDSPTGMFWPVVNFATNAGVTDVPVFLQRHFTPSITPARAGTNYLEYARLSQLTRNPV